ncbi:hypothetical protein NUW54_g9628 [Trametes sanguinea]|uniref:Uncharacterized protein n=1 Tax=Trametes sanguinea TaxID=158606 RepID=A0ACC1P4M9_9APHY|nr:hypothetical protein NUW54_g9628 [Trametes sanguinea]
MALARESNHSDTVAESPQTEGLNHLSCTATSTTGNTLTTSPKPAYAGGTRKVERDPPSDRVTKFEQRQEPSERGVGEDYIRSGRGGDAAGAAATGSNRISGAIAEDVAVASSSGDKDVDLDGLTRNSYIVIGLLAAVLILLIALATLAVRASKANKGYRAIPEMTGGAPPRFVDPYES